MNNTELLKQAAGKPTKPLADRTVADLMADSKIKAQMKLALPKHLTADRLARIATTEMRRVPALSKASPESFLGAIMQCAQLGLEPSSGLGHAYLIPFGNGKDSRGRNNVQLIIGYRGMIELARRSGQILSISARTVHAGDEFKYQYGLNEDLHHVPAEDDTAGELTHVYAVARLKDGGVQFEVMSRKQIEAVRASSKAGAKSSSKEVPWVTHFEEMAKKTVIRRLFKYLPVSVEIQTAVTLDERADAGIDQHNEFFLDGDYQIIDEPPEVEVIDSETGEVLNTETTTNELI